MKTEQQTENLNAYMDALTVHTEQGATAGELEMAWLKRAIGAAEFFQAERDYEAAVSEMLSQDAYSNLG